MARSVVSYFTIGSYNTRASTRNVESSREEEGEGEESFRSLDSIKVGSNKTYSGPGTKHPNMHAGCSGQPDSQTLLNSPIDQSPSFLKLACPGAKHLPRIYL